MAWFKKERQPTAAEGKKPSGSEGLWLKCNNCREIIYRKEVERNAKVCPKCEYHFPISVEDRIELLLDLGSFREWDRDLAPADPLHFKDTRRYRDRLSDSQERTGKKDALVIGEGRIHGARLALGVFHFAFMGGSMGSVVGEKVILATDRALQERIPLVLVTTSGGARMQEGIFSLMQMAKTAAAIGRLAEARVPYISILADPTFGGVTASFAMLGDVILAEPKALIGFAGPRVIEQTIRQQLPKEFQRAEFLLEHGIIDLIVPRKRLKETVADLLGFFRSDSDKLARAY
jgi:acetyl-CoA carboxylase carboxyl transferase subunit beta